MEILVLGGCCKKTLQNYENVMEAAKKLGVADSVRHIVDKEEILNLGVLATPAVIIDNKVVSAGRLLTVQQAAEIIEKFVSKSPSDCCKCQ